MTILLICETAIIEHIFRLVCNKLHIKLTIQKTNSVNDNYDLIIIDEAHKFRNDTSQMYEKLQKITKTDRKTPGTNGDIRKKIMLLSATPLNNHPSDIENQVYLFQDKRNSNLPTIKDLQSFFAPLKEEYDNLKKEKVLDVKKVKLIFDKIRDKVIEPLVIRRTRKDIENNKYPHEPKVPPDIRVTRRNSTEEHIRPLDRAEAAVRSRHLVCKVPAQIRHV